MKSIVLKIIGIAVILAAIVGLILTIGGVIAVWQVKESATEGLTNTLSLVDTTLTATSNALSVANSSLENAVTSVTLLEKTIITTGKAVQDTNPLFVALSTLVVDDLPTTIESTQAALESAQTSAQVIESTLTILSSIPLIGVPYEPDVPLGEALGDVSASLDSLPGTLTAMGDPLATSQGNLATIGTQVTEMASNVGNISTSLHEAQAVIAQYQGVVSNIQTQLSNAIGFIPRVMTVLAWFLTVVLVWLAITQLALLFQGLEMMGVIFFQEVEGEEKIKEG